MWRYFGLAMTHVEADYISMSYQRWLTAATYAEKARAAWRYVHDCDRRPAAQDGDYGGRPGNRSGLEYNALLIHQITKTHTDLGFPNHPHAQDDGQRYDSSRYGDGQRYDMSWTSHQELPLCGDISGWR